jgi:2-dehydro-3-deoxygluconokinase
MAEVVTFGEAMLRLSPPGRMRLEQARALEVWPAGAELNVAVGLARLGTTAAWVSRLPRSPLGEIVLAHARSFGVDVSGVLRADEGRIGLYFVEVAEPPRASRALYDRAASAFATLDPRELAWEALLAGARALHVSGITPALSESCARATADALAAGRDAGCQTSYDLNLRHRLAPPARWRARVEEVADAVDTLICSVDDAGEVFGLRGGPEGVAVRLREALGVARVVVSRRVAHGEGLRRESVAVDEAGAVAASSPVFRATEPVGAGDAFCAGFIRGLLTDGLELGGAMAALKQAVPGDAPIVDAHDVELALADEARMQR